MKDRFIFSMNDDGVKNSVPDFSRYEVVEYEEEFINEDEEINEDLYQKNDFLHSDDNKIIDDNLIDEKIENQENDIKVVDDINSYNENQNIENTNWDFKSAVSKKGHPFNIESNVVFEDDSIFSDESEEFLGEMRDYFLNKDFDLDLDKTVSFDEEYLKEDIFEEEDIFEQDDLIQGFKIDFDENEIEEEYTYNNTWLKDDDFNIKSKDLEKINTQLTEINNKLGELNEVLVKIFNV